MKMSSKHAATALLILVCLAPSPSEASIPAGPMRTMRRFVRGIIRPFRLGLGHWSYSRKTQLKVIGLMWHMDRGTYPVFPADDVRSLVEAHRHKDWTYAQAAWIGSALQPMVDRLQLFAMACAAVLLGVVYRDIRRRKATRRSRSVKACLAVMVLACAYPMWMLLFLPSKSYDYVEDIAFVNGVRYDAPPDTIVAHDRLVLGDAFGIFVLFADGRVERLFRPALVQELEDQRAASAANEDG